VTKTLRCDDVMPGCDTVIEGEDESEVMARAVEHARNDHGIEQIPPEVGQKAQAAIHDK
jgi:predicted small metal-binding protein